MINGLSHITFIVKDIEKATNFFKEIFNAEERFSSVGKTYPKSKVKYFLINNIWIAAIEGDSLQEKTYNHIAFRVSNVEFNTYVRKIESLKLEIKKGRKRIKGESNSIYFYDYDNHLFEIHTGTLEERLKSYTDH